MILPTTPRHTLIAPHYSLGCRTDPTNGVAKAEAAKSFTKWWDTLTYQDITIFFDGSEQRINGECSVTYGYAIYQAQTQFTQSPIPCVRCQSSGCVERTPARHQTSPLARID